MKDHLMPFKHNIRLIARDKDGKIIARRRIHNTDVAAGRSGAAARLGGISGGTYTLSGNPIDEIAVTSDNAAITDADIGFGLVTAFGNNAISKTLITTTTTEDTLRVQAVISFGSAYTIRKAGLFFLNASVLNWQGYGLFAAAMVTPDLVMPASSALTVVWTVQIL